MLLCVSISSRVTGVENDANAKKQKKKEKGKEDEENDEQAKKEKKKRQCFLLRRWTAWA